MDLVAVRQDQFWRFAYTKWDIYQYALEEITKVLIIYDYLQERL